MISIKNLNKSFRQHHVLKDLNIEFGQSGIVGLLGPNGSGKTTLLKCILGMVLPDSGHIFVNNENILGKYSYRENLGYLPQIVQFPENLQGRELIQLMKNMKPGVSREQKLIDLFDLEKELDKKMGSLSGGNKQKINITLALMYDDPILILDEPSTGLDPLSLRNFKEFLIAEKARGKLIILTTHIMGLAEELADDILFMLDGKVYYNGSLDQLIKMQNANNLENAIAYILENKNKLAHNFIL